MLYWLPNAGATSARMYWEALHTRWMPSASPVAPTSIPTGISVFPEEFRRISHRWAERRYANLVRFNEVDRGGHFAALEEPERFVEEIRATFRLLR